MNRSDVLTKLYEDLRQRALDRHTGGTMWGLCVLRTKGMALWVRLWQEHAQGDTMDMPLKESVSSGHHLPYTNDEVVRVLAGMIWAFQKEAEA